MTCQNIQYQLFLLGTDIIIIVALIGLILLIMYSYTLRHIAKK